MDDMEASDADSIVFPSENILKKLHYAAKSGATYKLEECLLALKRLKYNIPHILNHVSIPFKSIFLQILVFIAHF